MNKRDVNMCNDNDDGPKREERYVQMTLSPSKKISQ
jgi:hypothetical protein